MAHDCSTKWVLWLLLEYICFLGCKEQFIEPMCEQMEKMAACGKPVLTIRQDNNTGENKVLPPPDIVGCRV